MLKRTVALLLALLLLLCAAGCAPEAPEEEEPLPSGGDMPGGALAEVQAADSVFTLNCDYGSSFNPYVSRSTINQLFMPLMYETIFELDGDFNLTSDYVDAWDSPDGMNWVFTLKTGYKLNNGHDLTASDLSYSVIQAMNSSLYKARMSGVMGVSASGTDVLMISMFEPNMLLPYLLTIPIIEYGTVTEEVPPGSGPYTLNETRDQLTLSEYYRDADKMPLDVIYLADYSQAEDTISAFENSLIDLVVNDKTGVFNLGFGRANETRYMDTTSMHYIGFNIARDIGSVDYVDVAKAIDGGICPKCGKPHIYTSRGIEVGNIFQLGTKYTESMDMTYVDQDGSLKHPIMGCYGIGVGRLAASVCEAHRDDYGPIWPMSIAPWHVQICSLRADQPEVAEASQRLYDELTAKGVEVLWDDRSVSAGVMFSDADLFGVPVRVVISPKGLKNGTIEIATRDKSMKEIVPQAEAVDFAYDYVVKELEKLECRL